MNKFIKQKKVLIMNDIKIVFINNEMMKNKVIRKSIEIMALNKLFEQKLIPQDRYIQLKEKIERLANA